MLFCHKTDDEMKWFAIQVRCAKILYFFGAMVCLALLICAFIPVGSYIGLDVGLFFVR